MPTRCRCPPDSKCGNWFRKSLAGLIRTSSSAHTTRSSRSDPDPAPWITSGSSTICRIVMYGSRLVNGSWNIPCARRRKPLSRFSCISVMSSPSKITLPAVGCNSRNDTRPSVVLPLPDSPTTAIVSSRSSESVTPSSARTVVVRNPRPRDLKCIATSRNSSIGTAPDAAFVERVVVNVIEWPHPAASTPQAIARPPSQNCAGPQRDTDPSRIGSADGTGNPAADRTNPAARPG